MLTVCFSRLIRLDAEVCPDTMLNICLLSHGTMQLGQDVLTGV